MTDCIVVDASVVTKWYLPEPGAEEALAWLEAAARRRVTLAAPDLMLYEVGNVLWKHVRAHALGPDEAESIINHLARSPIRLVDASTVARDALRTACLYSISVYDASYVALACVLDTRVVTADQRLVRALESTPLRGRAETSGSFDL